jgi:hypothetical protein
VPVYAIGLFELELDAFELRRENARIDIAGKPFDALELLRTDRMLLAVRMGFGVTA